VSAKPGEAEFAVAFNFTAEKSKSRLLAFAFPLRSLRLGGE
jgi:hypothetical protein